MAKKKRVEEPYVPYQPGDFAKGLMDLFTPGIKGIPVRLTKKRARILMDFCKEFESLTSYYEEKHGSDYADDICAAMQWIRNQIQKRWSTSQLYSD